MSRYFGSIVILLIVGSCNQPPPGPDSLGPFEPSVNNRVVPAVGTIPDAQGNPQTVAGSLDENGVQSDFVEGIVLVRPVDEADLNEFLQRYNGTVLSDDTIPQPPAGLGIALTDGQRRPTEYVVRIDLSTVDVAGLVENGTVAGLQGTLEFSSEAAMQTFAGVADAAAAGFDASPDYVSYASQAFPATLFQTQERPNGAGGFNDAFTTTRFQSTGSQSNVTLAWQFLSAHGIQRRVQIAIIDDGFWLNTNGTPLGTDSDFPANPVQYDFVGNDYFADGPNIVPCGATNPCFWHGTGSTGVATGILNNSLGAAGTGGLVGDPMLFRTTGFRSNNNWAIRTALAWGADVVSMSWGGDCNQGCRIYDREHTPFDDAVNAGSRAVFVASAGNGDSSGNGYDVDDPRFYHPCIEDHVICVGSLNNDATTKIGFSNFGNRLAVFAPTNIPVMSSPAGNDNNPAGPAAPQVFGGTSASAPFVAGVAGMMKAINPNLSSDEVATILRETAHPGVAPVTRYIDAYAAVRRAAAGINIVNDRFELNDLTATNLGAAAPYNQPNLNIDGRDRDYFEFQAANGSTVTINLQYPESLGAVSILSLEPLGNCGLPVFLSESDLAGRGQSFTYSVPGGAYKLGVKGDDINAYNLGISFGTAAFTADFYEPNNTIPTAKYIHSFSSLASGIYAYFARDPRVTIHANIHDPADPDYYIVRGSKLKGGEFVLLAGYPAVKVYGNESPIAIDVWRLNDDNTQGAFVGGLVSGSCTAQSLSIPLQADLYYLVRITGTPGRYVLNNGVDGDKRRFPSLVRDRIYEILNPLDPIARKLRFAQFYVFAADRTYSQIRVNKPNWNLDLYDFDSNRIAEGVASAAGRQLSLASTVAGQVYALKVTPQDVGGEEVEFNLEWDDVPATRVSANLVVNPGAEVPVNDGIPFWEPIDGVDTPSAILYAEGGGTPSLTDPGPTDRGLYLFAGGDDLAESGVEQPIIIDPSWYQAIDAGRVKFKFSAFLGGYLDHGDHVDVTLSFINAQFQEISEISVPTITPLERDNQLGLFPVEVNELVSAGTTRIVIRVIFVRETGNYNDGFADNFELILSDYTP